MDTIKHPKSEFVFDIAKAFEWLNRDFENKQVVQIDANNVEVDPKKDKIYGCPAGFYYFGTTKNERGWSNYFNVYAKEKRLIFHEQYTEYIKGKKGVSFYVPTSLMGMAKMTTDLAFKSIDNLLNWAYAYPDIWGGNDGEKMFYSTDAYSFEGELTLKVIADQWKSVATKLKEIEDETSVK